MTKRMGVRDYWVKIGKAIPRDELQECLDNRTPENLNRIMLGFMPMVQGIASKSSETVARRVSIDDLVQEGCLGVLEAAKRFKPEMGLRFITIAHQYAKGYMQNYVSRRGAVVRVPADVMRSVLNGTAHRDTQEVVVSMISPGGITSETSRVSHSGWKQDLEDRLDYPVIVEAMEALLSDRECEVLWLRSYGATLQDVGIGIGLTRERVRQVENQSLATLRRHFGVEKCPKFTVTHGYRRTGRLKAGFPYSTKKVSLTPTMSVPSKTRMSLREYCQRPRESRRSSSPSTSAR